MPLIPSDHGLMFSFEQPVIKTITEHGTDPSFSESVSTEGLHTFFHSELSFISSFSRELVSRKSSCADISFRCFPLI